MDKLIELPQGWSIRENKMVGVDVLDEQGQIVYQDVEDCAFVRTKAWQIFKRRQQTKKS